jgi:uncharacterized protein
VRMVLVGDAADAADDWITEHTSAVDVCVTSDIPLASRCLKKGARVLSPTGKQRTQANIGNALAGREIARHLRELGTNTRGPSALTKKDRKRACVDDSPPLRWFTDHLQWIAGAVARRVPERI